MADRYYLYGSIMLVSALQWKAVETGKNMHVIFYFLNIYRAFYSFFNVPATFMLFGVL